MEDKKGLYNKYLIEKADGSPVDQGAEYFVLRIDTDKHARVALKAYATSVVGENHQLTLEILQKVSKYKD